MKKYILLLVILLNISFINSQNKEINKAEIREDLNEIVANLSKYYIYLNEKNVDMECLKSYYQSQIENIKTEEETVLFFEYLLNEFYDNHLTLSTNRNNSFRLFAPIYISIKDNKPTIVNVWQTQIENLNEQIIGAEIVAFNGISFDKVIAEFPSHCNNKKDKETREWIANKIIAGRYSEPRLLTLKLSSNKEIKLDLDSIILKNNETLLSTKMVNDIGIIRINDALGNNNLVKEFDQALNDLSHTKGIVIDVRNTIFGGNTYVARGLMGRFIDKLEPYQKHSYIEKPKNTPEIERSWIEYVSPRLEAYEKPVVILVGRWTGSMGEGFAIGFEGMKRGEIVGSEMRRLAGEVFDFNFKYQNYGYKLTTTKLFHVNGIIREDYIPTNYIKQTTTERDEILEKGIELIKNIRINN